ncbi:MAG: asparagine synthase (glutamine-hydrolyzing) [Chloroflexota bacterium]
MCGITGKLNFDPSNPLNPALIQRMNDALTHRGPDDEGIWTSGPVGLGQRRLSIVDLSPTGHQPMCNEDGRIWITYNGETYNHQSYRSQLESRGHSYRGNSDTETILHLYEEYGRDCVQHMRGMFAFALWDEKKRLLLLARDRFGQKPLVYAQTATGLTFASEIKGILQDESVPIEINETAIHYYLSYGFVPSPMTAFQSINKLPPAHTLVWYDGKVSIEPYWSLSYASKANLDEVETKEQTLALLRESVQLRLMSDVPLGAFLSGGVDSSAVVALMAEAMSEPVKTFSIGFEEQSFDETSYARQVAQQYATDHHEFIVKADAMSVLPELVWAYGEPFADSSALPSYYVAKMTRPHVTVALNGDGGDEAFGGYDRYMAHEYSAYYTRLPLWLRQNILQLLATRLPEPTSRRHPIRRAKNFILSQHQSTAENYIRWLTLLPNTLKSTLYTGDFAQRVGGVDTIALMADAYHNAKSTAPNLLDNAFYSDIHTYLPDDLLVKMDIATMMSSLEGRSPFLDHKFAEFAASLPVNYKLHRQGFRYQSKYILKKALENHLSADILYRPKAGFSVPIAHWFRHEMRTTLHDVLLSSHTIERGLFQRKAVQTLLDQHDSERFNHRFPLWTLLMLELWFRTYVDRPRDALVGSAVGVLG